MPILINGIKTNGSATIVNGAGDTLSFVQVNGIDIVESSYSAESQQFFDRLSVQPSTGRKTLYAALIDSLVADGVWAKLDALYAFVSEDDADTDTALTNLVQAAFKATMVGTPGFTKDGGFSSSLYNWPAGSYIDSNFNPTSAGGCFTLNDAYTAAWVAKFGQSFDAVSTDDELEPTLLISPDLANAIVYMTVNGADDFLDFVVAPSPYGFYAASRLGVNTVNGFVNSSLDSVFTKVSTGLANTDIYFLQYGGDGVPQILVSVMGGNLTPTEHQSLYNAISTFLQATVPTPNIPTIGTATGGNAQASITFTPGASVGGPAETYVATSTPGSFVGYATSSPVVVTGLSNGTEYTFTIHATNSVNDSGESAASNPVTPAP